MKAQFYTNHEHDATCCCIHDLFTGVTAYSSSALARSRGQQTRGLIAYNSHKAHGGKCMLGMYNVLVASPRLRGAHP